MRCAAIGQGHAAYFLGQGRGTRPIFDARHQFPPKIIRLAVWPYRRLTVSYRDIDELLAGSSQNAAWPDSCDKAHLACF